MSSSWNRRVAASLSLPIVAFAALLGSLGCSTKASSTTGSGAGGDAGQPTPPAGDAGDAGDVGAAPAACTVPASCLGRFTLPGSTYQLPYYSTFPLTAPSAAVTDVVVFNQGLDRDADNDFATIVAAAQMSGTLAHTLVVTPHFEAVSNTDGTACSGHDDNPGPDDLLWACDTWSDGEAATNDASVTSYGALDALLTAIEATFPALARVTVSGFSAGGQMTQRYVAVNGVDHGASGPPFRYVIGDPSSYLYFDDRRPVNAANCTVAGCPDGFAPYAGAGACPGYDQWKYGTEALTGAAASLTRAQLQTAYVGRDVSYLLGTLDDAATTAADVADLDVTCPAEAEGPFRFQRGLAFYAYATTLLGAGSSKLAAVAGCAHSAPCVFQSAAGVAAVFGD